MLKFLAMSSLLVFMSCRDVCNKEHACSSDSNTKNAADDPKEKKSDKDKDGEDKVEVVIKNSEALPKCDDSNQNEIAYREKTDKYFTCRENAWEEFTPKWQAETEKQKDISLLEQFWTEAKLTMTNKTYLGQVCVNLLTVNSNHSCEDDEVLNE